MKTKIILCVYCKLMYYTYNGKIRIYSVALLRTLRFADVLNRYSEKAKDTERTQLHVVGVLGSVSTPIRMIFFENGGLDALVHRLQPKDSGFENRGKLIPIEDDFEFEIRILSLKIFRRILYFKKIIIIKWALHLSQSLFLHIGT